MALDVNRFVGGVDTVSDPQSDGRNAYDAEEAADGVVVPAQVNRIFESANSTAVSM